MMIGTDSDQEVQREAIKELFWESLSPALREQLVELSYAETWTELAKLWGWKNIYQVKKYVKGPLRKRLERELGAAGLGWIKEDFWW